MARVAQDSLERRRDHRLGACEHLRKPFGVVDEGAGDIVTPVVGDRYDQNVLDAIRQRPGPAIEAVSAVIGQTGDHHGVPLWSQWAPCWIDLRALTLAESI